MPRPRTTASSPRQPASRRLGIGIVGLFSLLAISHFFAKLSLLHAVLLLGAPLLGWLPELPYARRLWPRLRGLMRVLLVGALVAFVVWMAQRQFAEDAPYLSGI